MNAVPGGAVPEAAVEVIAKHMWFRDGALPIEWSEVEGEARDDLLADARAALTAAAPHMGVDTAGEVERLRAATERLRGREQEQMAAARKVYADFHRVESDRDAAIVRAEAAEAKVAAVEALADKWESADYTDDATHAAHDLRAAIARAQADTTETP